MHKKSLLLAILGLSSLRHHRFVAGVFVSSNQTFYECHGQMGVITLTIGILLMFRYRSVSI